MSAWCARKGGMDLYYGCVHVVENTSNLTGDRSLAVDHLTKLDASFLQTMESNIGNLEGGFDLGHPLQLENIDRMADLKDAADSSGQGVGTPNRDDEKEFAAALERARCALKNLQTLRNSLTELEGDVSGSPTKKANIKKTVAKKPMLDELIRKYEGLLKYKRFESMPGATTVSNVRDEIAKDGKAANTVNVMIRAISVLDEE